MQFARTTPLRCAWFALFALMFGGLLSACAPADANAASQTVRNADELRSALRRAGGGDTILMAPGAYGDIEIRQINKGGMLTIAAADPRARPEVSSFRIQGSSDLTFRDIDVVLASLPGFNITSSKRIRLEGLLLKGRKTEEVIGGGNGIQLRGSRDVSVTGSEFRNLGNGLSHLDSEGLLIQNNRFHEIRVDGIHGGGTSNVSIIGNAFWDFSRRPGEHPDAIQFWTKNQKAPVSGIQIVDNLIIRGAGGPMQGMFITDQSKGRSPYSGVVVKGNAVVGAMYHGITISTAVAPVVEDNIVVGYQDMNSWIAVSRVTDGVVRNNQATTIRIERENTNMTKAGNKTVRAPKVGDARAIRAWYDKTKARLPQLPPEIVASIQ